MPNKRRISDEAIAQIEARRGAGEPCRDIAADLGISAQSVSRYGRKHDAGCRSALNDGHKDQREACVALWCAVLERAVRDAVTEAELESVDVRHAPKHTQRKVLNTSDASDYFATDDFEVVCGFIGVDPAAVREQVGARTA